MQDSKYKMNDGNSPILHSGFCSSNSLRLLALGVLVALAGAAAYLTLSALLPSRRAAPRKPGGQRPRPVAPQPRKTSVAPAPRRDADYWPQEPHPIALRYRTLMPAKETAWPGQECPGYRKRVWLVQFGGPLEDGGAAELKARGVEILLPTVAGAFHARASHGELRAAAKDFVPRIVGWCRLEPEDKLLPALRSKGQACPLTLPSPPKGEGEQLTLPTPPKGEGEQRLRVELYPGVEAKDIIAHVQNLGGFVHNVHFFTRRAALDVAAPAEAALRLAALEDVYAVDLARPKKRASNEEAATAGNITVLQAAPYSLTGAGMAVMVRDEGQVFEHPDLSGRVVLAPDVASVATSQHATHVAGTIGGTGLLRGSAAARGMARGCTVVSYDLEGDDAAEVLQARNDYGAVISNHSYGFATGWDNGTFLDNQNTFGTYSTFARDWDEIALSTGLLIVKSAGNDRNDSGPGYPHDGALAPDGEYYDTTDASSTGKNILVVGAAIDAARASVPTANTMVLASSSSGPCDDGRLRPEVIANGDTVNSCNNSAVLNDEYVSLTGASMACAVATGATVLFVENYQRRFGAGVYPAAHYLRALYAQTATDMGRPGPDYLHGFGMLDLAAAVSLFQTDSSADVRIVNASVSASAPERFYLLNSDGVAAIKATLCWTDRPGDVLAAKAAVNDLNLRLIRVSDQAIFFPYSLDPAHPEQPATNAVNSVDTIEQVAVSTPGAGSYLLAVRGTTLATDAGFTLVSSHGLKENLAPVAVIASTSTIGMPPFQVNFDGAASHDPDGSIARYLWSFGDGAVAEGVLAQHTYNAGSFRAVLTVIDNQGAAASSSVVIAVANEPPVAVLAVSPEIGLPALSCLMSATGSYDSDGVIASYHWSLGDGTTAEGPQVSHLYMASGLYLVTLTVTDNGNATGSASAAVLVGESLFPSASSFSLDFRKLDNDRFSVSSKSAPVSPDLVTTAGLDGSLRIGAAEYQFVLDERGSYKVPPLKVRLAPKRQRITITLAHADLEAALAPSGVVSRDVKNQVVEVPFALRLKDRVAGSTGLPYDYSARQGKTGRGRLIKPK